MANVSDPWPGRFFLAARQGVIRRFDRAFRAAILPRQSAPRGSVRAQSARGAEDFRKATETAERERPMAWNWARRLAERLKRRNIEEEGGDGKKSPLSAHPCPGDAPAEAGKGLSVPPFRNRPDMDKLKQFTETDEKEPTPFYAGREDLIRDILGSAKTAAGKHGRKEKPAGRTWVIQGAPGAGKSCLLEELAKDPVSRGCEPWDGQMPVVVIVSRTMLEDEAKLTKKIAESLLEGVDDTYRKTVEKGLSAQGGFRFGEFFSVSAQAGRRTVTAPPDATLESLEKLDKECWERPLVIAVDEIQNVTERALPVLEKLHLGDHRLPVVPVYGGLSNSKNRLEEVGLTRLSPKKTVTLERLRQSDAERAVQRMLEECNVRNHAGSDIARLLALQTEGWPQHLHNGMVLLAEEIVERNGDLGKVDFERVLGNERLSREEGHENRLTPEMKKRPVYVARVMTAVTAAVANGEDTKINKVLKIMKGISESGKEEDECLPEGMQADEFLERHLVRRGALQEGNDRNFSCPIPCFARFLIREGGKRGQDDMLAIGEETPQVPPEPEVG